MALGPCVVVQSGDTLSQIAQDFLGNPRLSSLIAEINQIQNSSLIFPGMILRLPGKTPEQRPLQVDDVVEKTTGDYRYKGVIKAAFSTAKGARRFVVENADGMLFIFNERQLTRVEK